MRSIFIATIILFLLTACGTAAQPVAPTAIVTISYTPTLVSTEIPTATITPTPELPLPEIITKIGLPAEDSKNFAAQPDGSVIDKRDGAVAVDSKGEIVSIRYGDGWEVVDGKMQVKDVSLDGLNCVKEGKECVTDTTSKWYKNAPAFEVNGVSTGSFEKKSITLKTGKIGVGEFVIVQTQDKNKSNVHFPLLVQFVDNESPLWNVMPFGISLWKNNYDRSKTSSGAALFAIKPMELKDILPPSFIFDLYFLKGSNKSRIKFNGEQFKYDNFYSDSEYLTSANKFLQSLIDGDLIDNNQKFYLINAGWDYPNSDIPTNWE